MAKKPAWVVEKEQTRRAAASETIWLFGLHAVRDALSNPMRQKLRLIVTKNAADRIGAAIIDAAGIVPEMSDARRFPAPLDPSSVHQGAALEVRPLDWGALSDIASPEAAPCLLALDRVTDPHNVGAILRSAEVFGARAVIAPARHAAPESGALAKTASGALERQPYLRVPNLGDTLLSLEKQGFTIIGLDSAADADIETTARELIDRPVVLVMGAEGPGLRQRTRDLCHNLVRIPFAREFGSLNVSNAAAIALYAMQRGR
ncbi:MAG: 23S rRNA (guanosine(2251)-2'-O)-methyltransferase RlmB [Pseudomonadota bacterium]